ncbi:hypothetical protein [Mongoliitalea lutea]|uniref:IPT/TIG domain-containing protein n=1 Tax=Mongoliitalea lutea TaxID=849756 RepID=A0A8J3D205_9BACT|nr:hypothetical protein [Mongoliitalea lutea]GHB50856.1 hypothetical protein GCM10008106_34640 [Mongoliitalea lutea]
MKSFSYLFVLISLCTGLISCHNEEPVPLSHPRFSVAFVQDIDANRVQFAANVFDYGSEEILEFGFAFGTDPNPRKGSSEFVKQGGKPDAFFSLDAAHGMKNLEKYYVAAYMITKSNTVYSEGFEFTSQGSDGFIFENITIPDPLYFGDTITVFGKNISRLPTNYSIYIEGQIANVIKTTDTFFQFLVPKDINFEPFQYREHTFQYNFQIDGKTFYISKPFNFRKPTFKNYSGPGSNFNQTIILEGDYLEDVNLKIVYKNGESEFSLPLRGIFKDYIRFLPAARFDKPNPTLEVSIRGERYIVENGFKLNPTQLEPNQSIEVGLTEMFTVQVSNLNPHGIYFNKAIASNPLTHLELYEDTNLSNRVYVHIEPAFGARVVSRNMKIFMETFGEPSTHAVDLTFTDQFIPVAIVHPDFFSAPINGGNSTTLGGVGYFFNQNKIFTFEPETNNFHLLLTDNFNGHLANTFALGAPNGRIYMAGNNQEQGRTNMDFFQFDPISKRISRLANLPVILNFPKVVYATPQYLYVEGGFSPTGTESSSRWRYSIQSNTWAEQSNKSIPESVIKRHLTFQFEGKLWLLGRSETSEQGFLATFNESTETWTTISTLSIPNLPVTNDLTVIGSKIYYNTRNQSVAIDLQTFEVIITPMPLHISPTFRPLLSVRSSGKYYIFDNFRSILEFDPAYF